MELRFHIDPENNEPHIRKHVVSEREVEQVLEAPLEDRGGKDESRVAIGQTHSGRLLRVIYIPEPRGRAFVITAYELGPRAKRALRRRLRRKP